MPQNDSSLLNNSKYVLFSRFTRLIGNYVVFVLIARIYSIEDFGKFSLTLSISNLVLVIADFGFDLLLTTEVSSDKKNVVNIVNEFLPINILTVSFASIVMAIVPLFMNLSSETNLFIFVSIIYMALTSLMNFNLAVFRGLEKFNVESKIVIFSNLFLLALIFPIVLFDIPLFYVIISFILFRIFSFTYSLKHLAKIVWKIKVRFSSIIIKKRFKQITVFAAHFIFGNIYFKIDTILLGAIISETAVGEYQAAFKILLLILIVPEILRSVLIPRLSYFFENNYENWYLYSETFLKLLSYLAFPIAFLSFTFSKEIMFIIYGKDYTEYSYMLKLFAFVIILRFMVDTFNSMLTTSKNQKKLAEIVILGTFISVISNIFLIKHYGIYGAIYSSIISNLIIFILVSINYKSLLIDVFYNFRFLITVIIFGGFLFLSENITNLLNKTILSLLYILLFITFSFRYKDFIFTKNLLTKKI